MITFSIEILFDNGVGTGIRTDDKQQRPFPHGTVDKEMEKCFPGWHEEQHPATYNYAPVTLTS